MHGLDFLRDLLVAFALGGVVVYALRSIKLPPIVGLLVAGALLGPHGFSLIRDPHRVEILAEIGVVLLLFTIGLEFSLGQLAKMWRVIVIGGGGQVALTIGVSALIASQLGITPKSRALFFGFLVALSSTAIVLRLLGSKGELTSPHGRLSLGVLLFQDLAIVPLVLLTPYLAGGAAGSGSLGLTLLKAAGIVIGVVIAARKLVPPLLYRVVKTRSRELFLTLLVVLCLGTAWVTSFVGLSLSLGAFLAGLAISESEYSHQALAEAMPFRDTFGSLFFLSIGMLMDAGFVLKNPVLVLGTVLVIMVVKFAAAALPLLVLGHPLRAGVQAAMSLAQIGEFAFVLAQSGVALGLLNPTEYQTFLAASVISLTVTPGMLKLAAVLAPRLSAEKRLVPWTRAPATATEDHAPLSDHVVIVGFGINGENLAHALTAVQMPFVVVELNPETVRRIRSGGIPVLYGDSTRAEILHLAGIQDARALVIAISDAAAVRATVGLARHECPDLHIVVRTRFVSEVDELKRLGADEVIPEEFETSIELFRRLLTHFAVPPSAIQQLTVSIRERSYGFLRAGDVAEDTWRPSIERMPVDELLVAPGSQVDGRSLGEVDLRRQTGLFVVAVRRGDSTIASPQADFVLLAGDAAVVVGDVDKARSHFAAPG